MKYFTYSFALCSFNLLLALSNLSASGIVAQEPRAREVLTPCDDGSINVREFGAQGDGVTDDTAALQEALNVASGGLLYVPMGVYVVSQTIYIPAGTTIIGHGKYSGWSGGKQGSIFTTIGDGDSSRWTDITGFDLTDDTPMFVAQGDGVLLENISILTGAGGEPSWSIGVFFPSVKQCGFDQIYVSGFTDACIYLDATWSNRNTTLMDLHPNIYPSTGMNEFHGSNFWLIGGGSEGFGIKIQGTTREGDTVGSAREWLWGWGGTSDIHFTNGRLSGKGRAGGAFSHDAQLYDANTEDEKNYYGQTITLRSVSLRLSSDGLYAAKLNRSNRILFDGCYAESVGSNAPVIEVTSNTQNSVDGILRINDKMNVDLWLNGVDTGYSGGNTPWEVSRCITTYRADGRIFSPNLTASVSTSKPLKIKSFRKDGEIRISKDDGSKVDDYLRIYEHGIRPEVASSMVLGTVAYPFRRVVADEVIVDPINNVQVLSGSGSPEGIVASGVGSLYLRSDGGAGTSLYVKESGSGKNGWIGK
jgi:hypothetical protein